MCLGGASDVGGMGHAVAWVKWVAYVYKILAWVGVGLAFSVGVNIGLG